MKVSDMLCVANHWDEDDLTEEGGKSGHTSGMTLSWIG